MSKKAVVAMSGGVDSSVTAALLKEEGYDVTGIMLKLWKGDELNHNSGCCNLGAADDARRVADRLDIPFYVFNFADRFEETVVRDFHDTYSAGRTPNPCVRCNLWIKFDALLERAKAFDADVLATGHYARVRESDGRYRLLRGVDTKKDQSYVLWMLTQSELAMCRFPVGEMVKTQTRAIAEELGLRTAHKPDSQEICFVREGDLDAYVSDNIPEANAPGLLVDTRGTVIGEHRGIGRYTIGQRKGLGISLGEPVFVTDIDATTRTVTVGRKDDLLAARLQVAEARFTTERPAEGTSVLVQHRAHGDVAAATITMVEPDRFAVHFESPVEAVAPGQSAALYSADDPDELLGGGIIEATTAASAAA
ncbi:MAG: tRNA 2-thiouridine(34) synthase MnmA [Actinomycetota bacterium]